MNSLPTVYREYKDDSNIVQSVCNTKHAISTTIGQSQTNTNAAEINVFQRLWGL